MRLRLEVDNQRFRVLLEIPTAEAEKYRKWLTWFIATSLPVLFSYTAALKFLPPGTVPPPAGHEQEYRK
jgi:hypothetical protein